MRQGCADEVGAQRAEARAGRLVGKHKSGWAGKLAQENAFAAGACAHIQRPASRNGGQGQGRKH